MNGSQVVTVSIDHKSPHAYLAYDLAYELEPDLPHVTLDWLPSVLDIPSDLGNATLDHSGRVWTKRQRTAVMRGYNDRV